ncbi:MAG: hypothetical protein WBL19_00355 [Minisyncoccia bacterium]
MSEQIVPAILASSKEDFRAKLAEIPKEIKLIHIDVLEGDFWAEISMPFEAHIMSQDFETEAGRWFERGANKIIVHELTPKIKSFRGRTELGLAVNMEVPLEEIFPLVPEIDFLHLMSIAKIGRQGNPFDERIFDRIKSVKEKFPSLVVSLDGGIKTTNWDRVKDSGADRFIVGSGFKDLWNSLTKK